MSERLLITFLYALGDRVRYVGTAPIYIIVERTYTEREVLAPVVTYRLARAGVVLDSAYESDLEPVDER